jgi:opacity protein-like surface antigen
MFKNKLLLILFCTGFLGFSQVKKESDTIYIYEEVIVYDTIYIEKPLARLQLEKVIVSPAKRGIKPFLTVIQNNKKIVIPVDALIIERRRKTVPNSWKFAAKITTGFNSNSLFEDFGTQMQMSYGLGLFVNKTLFHPNFSLGIGIETSLLSSSLNSNASNSDSFLNGYYFTENGSPKLFEGFNNKGFQVQIPIQFYWKIKKFTPSIGVFGNKTTYEATFTESSGNLPLQFDRRQKFNAQTFYFGYLFQLEYAVFKNWSVGINYSYSEAKNLTFKSDNESFAVDKKIKQNAFGVGIFYGF